MKAPQWVAGESCGSLSEARLLESVLKGENIACRIAQEFTSSVLPHLVRPVILEVREDHLARAREVIETLKNAPDAFPDDEE